MTDRIPRTDRAVEFRAQPPQTRSGDTRDGDHRLTRGRYHVSELLGHGGLAEVYLAHDTVLDRQVAIKVLRAERLHEPGMVDRFQQEAETIAGLDHPGIVSVLDFGDNFVTDPQSDLVGRPYIVMEYLDGATLQARLNEQTSAPAALSVDEALRIMSQVLASLAYGHGQGVVHGDVTATNVMLTTTGLVKLIDFGSSAQVVTEKGATMPLAHDATLRYVPPERAQGELFDARADLYSAGCLLYELLTGRTPFAGPSPVDLAHQHVHQQPEPPSTYRQQIDPELDAVVLRSLAKSPKARHQSAQDFLNELCATCYDR